MALDGYAQGGGPGPSILLQESTGREDRSQLSLFGSAERIHDPQMEAKATEM